MRLNGLRRRWGSVLAALTLLLAITLPSAPAGESQGTRLDQQLDLIQQRTSSLRQLESKGTVSHTFMRREDLRSHYEAMFFEETSPEDIEISQRLLEVLGYIDPSVDIFQVYLDVLSEEVLGFYDKDDRSIYVISDRDQLSPGDTVTLAHEFDHALQDENFDLNKGFDDRKDNNDRTLAYQAVVEGDAVVLQSLYALRYLTESERRAMNSSSDGQSASHAIDTAPLILKRELYFPYEDGALFLAKRYAARNSWADVNAVWANPPESTEQVLHPEKYLAGEKPIDVTLPDLTAATGPGWRKLTEDTMGELDLQILFEQYTDDDTAKLAAGGWGGDRFQLFRRDSDGALAYESKTVWDTEQDAIEFFQAYQQVVQARHGGDLQPIAPSTFLTDPSKPAPDAAWAVSSGNWHYALVRDGASVVVVTASDPGPLNVVDLLR